MNASPSSSTPKKIALRTSDGQLFDVDESTILKSQTIKYMIDDNCADSEIPLPNVTGKVLGKVIEYFNKHEEEEGKEKIQTLFYHSSSNDTPLAKWEEEFVKFDGDQAMLFDVIVAANYLDIKGLLDLTCKSVADMMKGKSPEEIRETFHIVNDYTKEEEEEVRRENQWAFD